MANASAGNLYFFDTASASLDVKNVRIVSILVHCTHATNAAVITLGDNNSGTSYPTLIDFEVPAANDFELLKFDDNPLVFPNGLRVKTLTNCTITVVYKTT